MMIGPTCDVTDDDIPVLSVTNIDPTAVDEEETTVMAETEAARAAETGAAAMISRNLSKMTAVGFAFLDGCIETYG